MRYGIIFLLTFIGLGVRAQNLVPNPGFEEYSNCPQKLAEFDNYVLYWFDPTTGTPDYFNKCDTGLMEECGVPYNTLGYRQPYSGVAYAGLGLCFPPSFPIADNTREYIEVELKDSLSKDSTYYAEFFVSLCKRFQNCLTSSIGIYFSRQLISKYSSYDTLNYVPQIENDSSLFIIDTSGWQKISGYYIAIGGEKYITIGNFYPDGRTPLMGCSDTSTAESYVYIDDVSIYIKSQADSINSVRAINAENAFTISPNPNNSNFTFTYNITSNSKLVVYDVLGRVVTAQPLNENKHSENVKLNDEEDGLYIIQVSNDKGFLWSDKILIEK